MKSATLTGRTAAGIEPRPPKTDIAEELLDLMQKVVRIVTDRGDDPSQILTHLR